MADMFSRVEDILKSIINSESYTKQPLSRVEALLLQVKTAIETNGGGGGGPTTPIDAYTKDEVDQLIAAVTYSIVTLTKDGLMSKEMLSELEVVIDELDTLTGSGSGSIINMISTEIAKVVADAPESFDTLKEIADWIADHPEDTADMNSRIIANTNAISSLNNNLSDLSDSVETLSNNFESQIGEHMVLTDVPVNAKFTDTIYDDTEIQNKIEELGNEITVIEGPEALTDEEVIELWENATNLITNIPLTKASSWNVSSDTPVVYYQADRARNTSLIVLPAGHYNVDFHHYDTTLFDAIYLRLVGYNSEQNRRIVYTNSFSRGAGFTAEEEVYLGINLLVESDDQTLTINDDILKILRDNLYIEKTE